MKLLVQMQVYDRQEISLLRDAYHSRFPVSAQTEEVSLCSLLGTRWEMTTLPMPLTIPTGRWSEIIDLSVQPQTATAECQNGRAEVKGRMQVCVIARDADGEVVYDEFVEEYGLEYACSGNAMRVAPKVTEWRYRMLEDKLELQVKLCVAVTEYDCCREVVISDLHLQRETPYPKQRVTALLYYADSGESVWDIGRACHVSPECILAENALEDERIGENTVVVIPVVS